MIISISPRGNKIKAVIIEEPNKIRIQEIKKPKIGEYEVLLQMKSCGICNGTDLKIIAGHLSSVNIKYPAVLGHEGVGEVVKVGKKVRTFKIGDLILEPATRVIDKEIGSAWGHFAEYAVASDYLALLEDDKQPSSCLKSQQIVPKDIEPEDATILLTLKETLSGLLNFGFKKGMSLVVFGDGPVGCALVKFARLLGATVIIGVGHWDKRLERMKNLGADYVVNEKTNEDFLSDTLQGSKIDMVIDAVGKNQIVDKGSRLIRRGGKIGIYGVFIEPQLNIKMAQWPNNASIQILQWPLGHADIHNRVIEYVRSGAINPKDFYTHIVTMDQIEKGIQLVRTRKALKVVVKIE